MRRLSLKERPDLVTVRQIAAAEGRGQRALLRPRSIRPGVVRTWSACPSTSTPKFFMKLQVYLAPVQYPSPLTTPTTLTSFYDPGLAAGEISPSDSLHETPKTPLCNPVFIAEAAMRLESIFLVGVPTKETMDGYNLERRNILRPTEEAPDLTDELVGQALAFISAEY